MTLKLKKNKQQIQDSQEKHGADPSNDNIVAIDTVLDNNVTCICGASCETFQLSGQSVESARFFLSPILNIDPDATVLINGIEQPDNHVLESGDQLKFVKKAGEKGANRHV